MAARKAIYDRIEADNPKAAAKLDARLVHAASRLVDHPAMGRPGRVAGTRELVAHRHYVLVYKVAEEAVSIVAVLHTSRRWPPVTSA
jgi:addiction module RelE/StbE family toxin